MLLIKFFFFSLVAEMTKKLQDLQVSREMTLPPEPKQLNVDIEMQYSMLKRKYAIWTLD